MLKLTPEAKAGVTVLLSLVLLTTMVMALGRIDFGRSAAFEINLLYNTVDGLREGAPVRYAGVNVGTVSAIQLASDGVLVKVTFDRHLLIPADSQFAIKNVGILGDKYIEIQPGIAQQLVDSTQTITGKEPVVMDNLLSGLESTLFNLNRVIEGITEITGSDQLQQGLVETGDILKDTVSSLKTAVDQVAHVAVEVQGVVEDISSVSKQLPDLNIKTTFNDIQTFSKTLAELNLQGPVDQIHEFTAQLNTIPLVEIAKDLQRVTNELAEIDFAGIKSDLYTFTNMLASTDIQPLIIEIMTIAEQINALDLGQRGEELARFTAELSQIPLADIATDLKLVTNNLTRIPFDDIADNIYFLSSELAEVPIGEIIADLKVVTQAIKDFGWEDLSYKVAAFASELGSFDMESLLAGVTDDLNTFSQSLARIELDTLLSGVTKVVDDLALLTAAVDPGSIENIINDLAGTTENVRLTSREINLMVSELNTSISRFSAETFIAIDDIKSIVSGVENTVASINFFVDDLVAEGDTASDLKATLANIQNGTKELVSLLEMVTVSITSESGPVTELQTALSNIQKLNADIENIRTMGEKVEIKSTWGAQLNIYKDEASLGPDTRLMANIGFEFWPVDGKSFLLIGMRDILGTKNHLQLQYGRQSGIFRQRYGIVDTSLGVGFDGQVSEKLGLTAELTRLTTHNPSLSLRGIYSWTPDWRIGVSLDDFLSFDGPTLDGFSVGIERKF